MTLEFINTGTQNQDITFYSGGDEILRIGSGGFYVNGTQVESDGMEEKVYESFKQWLVYQQLSRRN